MNAKEAEVAARQREARKRDSEHYRAIDGKYKSRTAAPVAAQLAAEKTAKKFTEKAAAKATKLAAKKAPEKVSAKAAAVKKPPQSKGAAAQAKNAAAAVKKPPQSKGAAAQAKNAAAAIASKNHYASIARNPGKVKKKLAKSCAKAKESKRFDCDVCQMSFAFKKGVEDHNASQAHKDCAAGIEMSARTKSAIALARARADSLVRDAQKGVPESSWYAPLVDVAPQDHGRCHTVERGARRGRIRPRSWRPGASPPSRANSANLSQHLQMLPTFAITGDSPAIFSGTHDQNKSLPFVPGLDWEFQRVPRPEQITPVRTGVRLGVSTGPTTRTNDPNSYLG